VDEEVKNQIEKMTISKNNFFLGNEINLLKNYPAVKRDTNIRADHKTKYDHEIARRFGKDFFDGDRKHGYGGFKYNPKFWEPVIPTLVDYWNLDNNCSLLDVGCAKGFMLHDLKNAIPKIKISGIDISEYAIENAKKEIKQYLKVGDAKELPYEDNSFDIVIAINTIHNLNKEDCAKALKEISRVAKKNSFITVDAFRNEEEKKRMFEWNLTAKTILSVSEWKKFFKENNYTGDFYWFIP
jgi:2-polyprenyl-3-methyl-5-hydroxy-6-metoxy-1,4-benzoquinol methylase|tara:strand:+ start:733 stop:1452 length:720 start_codon:yes stop_codon:yes gene_type:complete